MKTSSEACQLQAPCIAYANIPVSLYSFHQFRQANCSMMENDGNFHAQKRAQSPVFNAQSMKRQKYGWSL